MIQRNYLIAAIILFFLLVGGGSAAYFFTQYKQVHVVITDSEAVAELTTSADNTQQAGAQEVHNNSTVWLKKQTYYAHFTDADKFNTTAQSITIDDKTTSITLDPSFSNSNLNSMLQSEKSAISQVITQSVKGSGYVPAEGSLYHRGEWYATTLTVYKASSADPDIANPDDADTYYVVLKKENNSWKLVAGPSLIITKPEHPEIPSYIIENINPAQSSS